MSQADDTVAPASPYAGLGTLSRAAGESIVDDGRELWSDEKLQAAFSEAITMYARKFDAGHRIAPYSDPSVTATAVLITASMMLKAAEVETFELGMWQTFSGIK